MARGKGKGRQTYTVGKNQAGQRLDTFLSKRFPHASRSRIQKMIEAGSVTVQGKSVPKHHFLRAQDSVIVKKSRRSSAEQQGKNRLARNPFSIIEQNDQYVVIEKSSGIAVHPGSGVRGRTLSELLSEKYPDLKGVGPDPSRPGIVHRLDQDVSGLMVVARTQASYDHLRSQFEERTVEKNYTVLVHGRIEQDEGVIDFKIKRGKDGRMAAIPADEADDKARDAVTLFRVTHRYRNHTLLQVRLKTGRTHQIRVHFFAYDHPVVGDKLYKPRRMRTRKPRMSRIFLHASGLSFYDRAGTWQMYASELPADLGEALKSTP